MRLPSPPRRVLVGLALAIALGAGVAGGAVAWVTAGSKARITAAPLALPPFDVALVLGCVPGPPGGPVNPFYERRIAAAAELWHAGAVRGILVSGDNSRRGYDEPGAMRADLIAAGVPGEFVTCDFAGFRTLDSVVRAREVFGVQRAVIVSQEVHLPRALYLARAHDLDAWGFAAESIGGRSGRRFWRREVAARLLAFLDVELFGRGPRYLGAAEAVALRPSAAGASPGSSGE